jgi:hypothetical protein
MNTPVNANVVRTSQFLNSATAPGLLHHATQAEAQEGLAAVFARTLQPVTVQPA